MSCSRCAPARANRHRRAIHPSGEALESRQVFSVAGTSQLQCDAADTSSSDMPMWSSEPYDDGTLLPGFGEDGSSVDSAPTTSSNCGPIEEPLFTVPIDDDVDPLATCPGLDDVFCLPQESVSESSPPIESEPDTNYPDLDDPRVIRRLLKGARDTGLIGDELWWLFSDELP